MYLNNNNPFLNDLFATPMYTPNSTYHQNPIFTQTSMMSQNPLINQNPTFSNNPFVSDIPINYATDSSSECSLTYNRNVDHIINGKEGKMFVGGLHWRTTVESLRTYFEKYGAIEECVIMRDAKTKMTRGFGFVTFVDSTDVHKVLAIPDHYLDGKKIDPQIAIRHISPARSVNNICRKVFIGGVAQTCDVEDIKLYFSRYGQVEDAILKMDYPKKMHRGFGFITFVQSEVADLVCAIRYHEIHGKAIECKKAQKKEFVKVNTDATLAASNLLASLPQEQVLAIYNMLSIYN
ncbi:Msi-1 [Aphelenchoides besseyi]|nr:Msi-1 [Aphelenchoides besseyi]